MSHDVEEEDDSMVKASISLYAPDPDPGPLLQSLEERAVPESVARLWGQLALGDRSLILCLEAIVRSVRIDGTAPIDEVAIRYTGARARAEAAVDVATAVPEPGSQEDRHQLLESVLPGLAKSGLISMPGDDPDLPGAAITICSPFLRVALLEAGLIQLDTSLDSVGLRVERVAPHQPVPGAPQPDGEWSRIWFSLSKFHWSTLAMVSASPGESAIAAASMLADAGHMYERGAVELIDATGVTPAAVDQLLASMTGATARRAQMLIALDSPLENPAVIPIARHATIAVLCVPLGVAELERSRRAIETIGREHIVGSIAVR
ncbi:MAG: hypothetical protein V4813_13965 [Gemmatimonadota bacterium]